MSPQQRPFILISNDDGYHSNGIQSLVKMVSDFADVLVCAPDTARSGFSCGFSATQYLLLKRREDINGVPVWSCSGTPVDCIKIAIDQLCQHHMPDLIIGGINHGDNSTVNAHYSGTMGVAIEGCLKYIPSIAFSSCYYNEDANLEPARPFVRSIIKKVLEKGLPKGICLNVNLPETQEIKGVKVCRMTYGRWINEMVKARHPRKYDYYWVVGEYQNDEPNVEGTDQFALKHGYIAITPVTIDITAYEFMKEVEAWNLNKPVPTQE